MSGSEKGARKDPGAGPAPWAALFGAEALRRLARLAALRSGDDVAWVGVGGDRPAALFADVCDCRMRLEKTPAGLRAGSLSLLVSPELAASEGLDAALTKLRPALEVDGVLALVARVFIGAEVPEPLRTFWGARQADPMRSVKGTLTRFAALGFEPLTSELLAEPSLSEHDRKLLEDATHGGKGEVSAEAASGVRHGTTLGLFVGRRVESGSPPRWPRRGGAD